LDEERWCVGENINHIQLLKKENWDEKGKFKSMYEGDLVLWMPKTTKIKGGKFRLPWKGPYKVHKTFNNNIVELTSLGDDEVEKVNINKLKKYNSKSVVVDVMVANVYIGRYLNQYRQNKYPTTKPKNSSKLVPKPRKLPWIDSIRKIIDDEYFWVEENKFKSNEGKARSSSYKAKLKKRKVIIPYQLCPKRKRL